MMSKQQYIILYIKIHPMVPLEKRRMGKRYTEKLDYTCIHVCIYVCMEHVTLIDNTTVDIKIIYVVKEDFLFRLPFSFIKCLTVFRC